MTSRTGLFEGVPGPSPWYLATDTEPVPGFRWQSPDDPARMLTLLVGSEGPIAILGPYHYVLPLGERLLVWHQPYLRDILVTPAVRLTLLEPRRMTPLSTNLPELVASLQDMNATVLVSEPSPQLLLDTTRVGEDLEAAFPAPIASVKELLILCSSSGIEGERAGARLALLIAHPGDSTYRLYPQDWFNQGEYDFGYEWVTRVVRDRKSGRVHGEGFRMKSFVLDETLRNLA